MIIAGLEERAVLNVAVRAALAAGAAIMEHYLQGNWTVSQKEDCSPLTDADLASQEIITAALQSAFPHIPSINEEHGQADWSERRQWAETWLVDPLDGTREFVGHTGEFTVNIALVRCGVPVFGVVYAPAVEKLFFTREDRAWFVAARTDDDVDGLLGNARAIACTPDSFPEALRIVASRSHRDEATETLISRAAQLYSRVEIVSSGSSLKLCLLAAGEADFYPRLGPTMEWDTAAGDAVLRAAGGMVCDAATGQTLLYNRPILKNPGFLAGSPGVLHRFIVHPE